MVDQHRSRVVSKRDVLFVIFKRLKAILAIFLVTLAIVVLGILLSKPVYESSSKVIINREVSEAILRVAPWIPLYRSFDLEEEINSEIQLIKSRAVAETVVDQLDHRIVDKKSGLVSTSDPSIEKSQAVDEELDRQRRIIALQNGIGAEPVKKSDVIQISFRSHDPKTAMEVVEAVAEAYIDYRARIYRSSGAVDFFDEQIEVTRRSLDELESALKEYRQQEVLLSFERQETILLNKLIEFETSLTSVRKDIISTEAKLIKIREYMASPLQPLVPSLEIREENIIRELHDQLMTRRLRLNELLTKYTEDHRDVKNLRQEITMAEAELKTEVEKVVELQENSLEALRAEEQALHSTVNMLYTEVQALPEKELTISRLQRAIDNHKEVHSMLVLKREEARVAEASDRRIANVSVISPATLPQKPVKPQKGLMIFAGCFIGIIGAFGFAFVSEYLDHSLRSTEDVEHYLNLPVLACIPDMKRS